MRSEYAPGERPNKRLGQHFLHDAYIIDKIMHCLPAGTEQRIIEIGPGRGALTTHLAEKYPRLELIELDRDLVECLHQKLAGYSVQIHACDVLQFDFSCYAADKIFIVGNLPYNISTAVIFHLLNATRHIADMLFMLQKEVVERICADCGGKSYGRLSVMLQAQCRVSKQFDVMPGAFSPPPKVDSSLVRITPDADRKQRILNQDRFAAIVRAAFSQRRKKISNSLKQHISKTDLVRLTIPTAHRAEQLSISDYIRIANYMAQP